MKKFITTFLLGLMLTPSISQTQHKLAVYFQGQYDETLNDVTKSNNQWGMGLGLQLLLANTSAFKPTIDLTVDEYLMDDKVYRTYLDGTPIRTVEGMVSLFGGASFHPVRSFYMSFVAGPSFVGGQTLLGIKPSVGFYFSSKQRVTGKVSFINVFHREPRARENFSSLSFSLGAKLF
jgi:hypothetical protein